MLTREEILTKLQLQNNPREQQDERLKQLADTVQTRIFEKISAMLTEDDLVQLEKLLDAGNDTAIEDFLIAKVPDYNNWVAKVEEDTINELAGNIEAIDADVSAKQHSVTPVD